MTEPCNLIRLAGNHLVGRLRPGNAGLLKEATQDSQRIRLVLFELHPDSFSGLRLQIVGHLFENDTLSFKCCRHQARLFAVDRQRTVKISLYPGDLSPNLCSVSHG